MRPRLADPPGLRTSDTGDRDGECNKGECVGSAIKPCGRQDLVFFMELVAPPGGQTGHYDLST